MQDQIRMATFSKATAPDPTVVDLSAEVAEELTWQTLSDVEFKDVYLEELDAYYWMPTFGPKVLASEGKDLYLTCLLYTSPSPRDLSTSRMPSSA